MKIQIDLKDIIVFGLILLCLAFCLNLYWKMENIKLAQQVNQNTQSIQQIVTFLNQGQQAKAGAPSAEQPKVEKK
jgi:hypothetical protein